MRCPQTPEFWQRYIEQGDAEMTRHLQFCAACREEVERATHLPEALSHLPALEAPASLVTRFQSLAQMASGQQFTCAEALPLLEVWREGELDSLQAFLMEEHLLWCEPCAAALDQAELLSTALRAIPQLVPPASIAERLAAARLPWWRRMLQPAQPIWGRLVPAMPGLLAATALLMFCILRAPVAPQVASIHMPERHFSPASIPSPQPEAPILFGPFGPAAPVAPGLSENPTQPFNNGINPDAGQPAKTVVPPSSLDNNKVASVHTLKPPVLRPAEDIHYDNGPFEYPAPKKSDGENMPDMDTAPAPNEVASNTTHDDILRAARYEQLANDEDNQTMTPDLGKFAMAPPPSKSPEITPRPLETVSPQSNAEINAMLRDTLTRNKSHGKTTTSPATVHIAAHSGEMHADNSFVKIIGNR